MDGRLAREAAVLAGSACGVTVAGIWLTNLPPTVVLVLAGCAGAAMLLTRPGRPRPDLPAPGGLPAPGAADPKSLD